MIWIPVIDRGATTDDVSTAVGKVLEIVTRARKVAPVR
jgi:hypothetical protein